MGFEVWGLGYGRWAIGYWRWAMGDGVNMSVPIWAYYNIKLDDF